MSFLMKKGFVSGVSIGAFSDRSRLGFQVIQKERLFNEVVVLPGGEGDLLGGGYVGGAPCGAKIKSIAENERMTL